jgi:hypothetical protein
MQILLNIKYTKYVTGDYNFFLSPDSFYFGFLI